MTVLDNSLPQTQTRRNTTAEKSLFDQGYRCEVQGDPDTHRYGLRVYTSGVHSYFVNILQGTCECKGFQFRRRCDHLTEILPLCRAQYAELKDAFTANEQAIQRGDMNYRKRDEMRDFGTSIDNLMAELLHMILILEAEARFEARQVAA
jgi:hypothetical protein